MKTSEAFRKARRFVAKNHQDKNWTRGWCSGYRGTYLCFALDNAYYAKVITFAARVKCKQFIASKLGVHASIEDYLEHNHSDLIDKWQEVCGKDTKLYYNKVQETRHNWLTYMIAECEEMGD
jgi:hypothetical protein